MFNQKESAKEESVTPKSKKIEGILLFDGDTPPSPVTATGSLVRLADNKSGVSYHGANAISSTPSLKNISQSANAGKAENLKWI